ncbi:MAG: pentapeptide repeat-containing protein [Ornithinimicrobium sp.]
MTIDPLPPEEPASSHPLTVKHDSSSTRRLVMIVAGTTVLVLALSVHTFASLLVLELWPWDNLKVQDRAFEIVRAGVTAVGASGVGVAAAVAYRRQLIVEEQHRLASNQYTLEQKKHEGQVARDYASRDQDRRDYNLRVLSARRDRFAASAQQLANDSVAVRIAGVYSLAGLADEWLAETQQFPNAHQTDDDNHAGNGRREAQTCVDVLCAYLRTDEPLAERGGPPAEIDIGPDSRPSLAPSWDEQVRQSIVRILRKRLKVNGNGAWIGMDLDFTGATFRGDYDLDGAALTGLVSFTDARFLGGRFSFERSIFDGKIVFDGAQLRGGVVSFNRARFMGGRVSFVGARFEGSRVFFDGASFSGAGVFFSAAQFTEGSVTFNKASFVAGKVAFSRARFRDGKLSFGNEADARPGLVSGPWGTVTPPPRWPIPAASSSPHEE